MGKWLCMLCVLLGMLPMHALGAPCTLGTQPVPLEPAAAPDPALVDPARSDRSPQPLLPDGYPDHYVIQAYGQSNTATLGGTAKRHLVSTLSTGGTMTLGMDLLEYEDEHGNIYALVDRVYWDIDVPDFSSITVICNQGPPLNEGPSFSMTSELASDELPEVALSNEWVPSQVGFSFIDVRFEVSSAGGDSQTLLVPYSTIRALSPSRSA